MFVIYIVRIATHPKVLLQERFLRADESGVLLHFFSSANYNLRNIRAVRNYLTPQATEQLTHAFVSSYLDNCNSLFVGLPKYQISKLQKVQNAAARLVTKSKRSDSTLNKKRKWTLFQLQLYNILTQ